MLEEAAHQYRDRYPDKAILHLTIRTHEIDETQTF